MADENVGSIYYTVSADTAGLLKGTQQAEKSLDRMTKGLNSSGAAAREADMQMTKTATAIKSLGRETTAVSSSLAGLGRTLLGLVAIQGAGGLIEMAESYNEMAERIRMASRSTEEYEHVQQRLMATSQGTYRNLSEAQEMYIQTADALRSLGYTTDEVLDITDSLAYSFVKNAANVQRANSAIAAYSKSIQIGSVQADAWQSILVAIPSVIHDIADASGRSAEEVRALGAAGKLSIQDLNEGLRQSLGANKAAADSMATTVSDAFTNMRNSLAAFLGEANMATGATERLSSLINVFSDNIDTVVKVLAVAGSGALASYIAKLGASVAEKGKAIIAARSLAAEELRLAKAHAESTAAALAQARANIGLSGSHDSAAAAAAAHRAALARLDAATGATGTALRGLLGVLGGPVGIVAMLGVAALSFVDFKDKSSDARTEVDALTESIGNLTRIQVENAQIKLDKTIETLERETEALRREVASITREYEEFSNAGKFTERELSNVYETLVEVKEELERSEKALADAAKAKQLLADRAAELDGATRGAAAAQRELNAALAGFEGESGKALARLQERLTSLHDDTEVKKAERYLASLGDSVGEGFRAAYMSVAHAIDAFHESQKKLRPVAKVVSKEMRDQSAAAREMARGIDANQSVIADLNRALYETTLNAKQLAIFRAESRLNGFATAEEVAQVRSMAAALHEITELRARQAKFGSGEEAEAVIRGEVDPLTGGLFDDQYARYEAEAEAERERFRGQLERLKEARELQIQTNQSYDDIEADMRRQHNERLAQIDEAKNDMMLQSTGRAFGEMSKLLEQAAGDQKGIYKAMFAASKAFAIAESIVAVQTAIAKAAASAPFPANIGAMVGVAAATAGLVSTIMGTNLSMGGGRQYGGPVAPGSMYRINETGAPEILNTANGQQFLLPNTRGQVVSNKDATAGGGAVVNINVINNAPGVDVKATQRAEDDRSTVIDIIINDIAQDGRVAGTIQSKWGLSPRGY